jgi:hypothetical protein
MLRCNGLYYRFRYVSSGVGSWIRTTDRAWSWRFRAVFGLKSQCDYRLTWLLVLVFLIVKLQKLTLWSRVLLDKLIVTQLVKKFRSFYGTWESIALFTRAGHCVSPEPDQSLSRPLNRLEIHFHIVLHMPGPSTWSPHASACLSLFPIRSTCPALLILLYLVIECFTPLCISWSLYFC